MVITSFLSYISLLQFALNFSFVSDKFCCFYFVRSQSLDTANFGKDNHLKHKFNTSVLVLKVIVCISNFNKVTVENPG